MKVKFRENYLTGPAVVVLLFVMGSFLTHPRTSDARISLSDLQSQINDLQAQTDALQMQVDSLEASRSNCSWSSCIDTPFQYVCPSGQVLAGIDLPELGDNPNQSGCGNIDDVRFLCCDVDVN